jgi:hypothetical protein
MRCLHNPVRRVPYSDLSHHSVDARCVSLAGHRPTYVVYERPGGSGTHQPRMSPIGRGDPRNSRQATSWSHFGNDWSTTAGLHPPGLRRANSAASGQNRQRVAPPGSTVRSAVATRGVIR